MFKRTLTALALIGIMLFLPSPVPAQEEEVITGEGAVEKKIDELADKISVAFEGVEGKEEMNRIAVVRFTNLGPMASEKQLGQIVAELLTTALSRKPQFLLVEREQIEKVLNELKLSLLGLTEADNAEKVGKLLNARAIITGSVSEVGEIYLVNARQVDVATGEVLLTADVKIHQSAMLGLSYKYLVRRTRYEAMFRSFVPGWGQFYNDQPVKGFIFSGLELGLVGSAVTLYILANSAQDKSDDPNEPDRGDYYEKAKDRYLAGDILLYSALGVWVIGIVDAYLNGPDVEEVKVAESGPAVGFSKNEGLTLFAGEGKEREIGIAYNFRF